MFAKSDFIAYFDSILVKEPTVLGVKFSDTPTPQGRGGTFAAPRYVVFTQLYAVNDQILINLWSVYRFLVPLS